MSNLQGWVFHHNDYTGLWAAVRTSEQQDYWNKMYPHPGSKAFFNKDLSVLVDFASTYKAPEVKSAYGLFNPIENG